MSVVAYDFVPLSCLGDLSACQAASALIYDAVMALQVEPPCIGCSTRLIRDLAVARDQIISHDLFRRVIGDSFPYLWVQVRYDPAVRSLADLESIIERFRLATVDRCEHPMRFFK
jgi:hypothetical protein